MGLPDPVITPDHVYSKVAGSRNSAGRDCKVAPHVRVRVFPVGTGKLPLINGVVGGSAKDNATIVYPHVSVRVFPSSTGVLPLINGVVGCYEKIRLLYMYSGLQLNTNNPRVHSYW